MKKFMALFVALLFAFAMTSVAFAAEKPAAAPKADKAAQTPKMEEKKAEPMEKKAAAKEKVKVKQITGEVAAVDAATKTLVVKGRKAEVTVTADENALADIKVGDKVVVKYTEQDGKNIAKSVKRVAAKAEKKGEEKKAEPAKPAEPAKKKVIEGC